VEIDIILEAGIGGGIRCGEIAEAERPDKL
jgi:hypothetical protein